MHRLRGRENVFGEKNEIERKEERKKSIKMKRKRKTDKGNIAATTKWLKLEEMRTVVNTIDSILRWFCQFTN